MLTTTTETWAGFTAEYYDGTNNTLWGYGFTYDAAGGWTGTGTVTSYSFFGNWSEDLLIDIDGINATGELDPECRKYAFDRR